MKKSWLSFFAGLNLIFLSSCAFWPSSQDRDVLADQKLGLSQSEQSLQVQNTLTDLKEEGFEVHNQRLQREITEPLAPTDLSSN